MKEKFTYTDTETGYTFAQTAMIDLRQADLFRDTTEDAG